MKLRLRSVETKETLRIELPDSSTLQDLRNILSQRFPSSPAHPSSVHISLNRKDELLRPSPEHDDSLRTHGVISGDLIFFSLGPNDFSLETLITHSQTRLMENEFIPGLNSDGNDSQSCSQSLNLNANVENDMVSEFAANDATSVDNMDLDRDEPMVVPVKSLSVPGFLRKVFVKELGDDIGLDHKLTVVAVHAVLLESGFVGFDPVSNKTADGFHFSETWPSFAFRMSLSYTLPEVVGHRGNNSDRIDYAVLKFQSLGRYINVYGSLVGGSVTHSVRLDESNLVPFLNVAWANCGLTDEISVLDGFPGTTPEKEVFMFWRTVKDWIALPLLIDLHEKSGLPLPPCFMRLPTELKLMIFESLAGVDLAKVSCLCSELRYLALNDDLWKQKFLEEFGDGDSAEGRGSWKDKFANCWEARKATKIASSVYFPYRRRESNPFTQPGHFIVGGEYDLWPQVFGFPHPFGQPGRAGPRAWNFVPNCKLGRP